MLPVPADERSTTDGAANRLRARINVLGNDPNVPLKGVHYDRRVDQILAVFLVDNDDAAERFLGKLETIEKSDPQVEIVDAAIAHRTKLGRVKVHQTRDPGALKGGLRGGALGVVVGTILLGPAGSLLAVRLVECSPACTTASTTPGSTTSSCARSRTRSRRARVRCSCCTRAAGRTRSALEDAVRAETRC